MRKFRSERGALMNALMFVAVSLVIVGGMTAWLFTRMDNDNRTLAGAQLRAAINEYAQVITTQSNLTGVDSVKVGSTQKYVELNATVQLTGWTAGSNKEMVANLTATTTKGLPRTQTARVTLAPAGVAIYVGQDTTTTPNRPKWMSSSAGLPPLALRMLTPTSVVITTP